MKISKNRLMEIYRITKQRRAVLDREMSAAQAEMNRLSGEPRLTDEQELDLDRARGRVDRINAIHMMGKPEDKRSARGENVPPFIKRTGIVSDDALKASMVRSRWLEGK